MKKSTFILLFLTILTSCKKDKKQIDKISSDNQIDFSKIELKEFNAVNFTKELQKDSLNTLISDGFSSIMPEIKDTDRDKSKSNKGIDPSPLKMVSERLYTNFGETYRDNLDELMGKVLVEKEGGRYELRNYSIRKNDAEIETIIPTNGKLLSLKVTKNTSNSIALFLSASISDDKVSEYYISDISRAILKDNQRDSLKNKNLISLLKRKNKDLKYYKIITGATVTEIYSRDYYKKERKLKATNIPIGSVALSFDNTFFVSDENMKRQYKVGLITESLEL